MNSPMRFRSGRLVSAFTASLLFSTHSFAIDKDALVELDTMQVTATRTAVSTNEALSPVTVISREDIERWQVFSVQDAIQRSPGISIGNNGGQGKVTSIFMRGTNSDQVLVLIDGQRASSGTAGTTAIQNLPIELIERIEIVRGPRASLYGADANGGVIQIITRKGTKDGSIRPYFSAGGGSDMTYRAAAGVSGSIDNAWFSLNTNHYHTNGFNACNDTRGCFANEPDNDGFFRTGGSARVGYRFENLLEIEGNFLQTNGNTKFDGTFQNRSKTVNQVYGGRLKFMPNENWDIKLSAGRTKDLTDSYANGRFASAFTTRRVNVLLQQDYRIDPDHIITSGFEYWNDKVESSTNFTENSRWNTGYFAQYQGVYGAIDWVAGLRFDHNERFGGHLTGDVALGYQFDSGVKIIASYGRAFKAPSFNQSYFPGFGNENINPEQSQSVELQIRGNHFDIDWAINGYWTWFDNLIATELVNPATFEFRAVNVGQARIRGLELTAATDVYGFDIDANVSLLDPTDQSSGGNHGNVLARRAEQLFTLNIDKVLGNYDFGRFSIGTTVRGEGRRYNDAGNATRIAGFVTVDLRAEYRPHPDWAIQAKVGNLLDKDYETVRYFNQDDRNFMFTLHYAPTGF